MASDKHQSPSRKGKASQSPNRSGRVKRNASDKLKRKNSRASPTKSSGGREKGSCSCFAFIRVSLIVCGVSFLSIGIYFHNIIDFQHYDPNGLFMPPFGTQMPKLSYKSQSKIAHWLTSQPQAAFFQGYTRDPLRQAQYQRVQQIDHQPIDRISSTAKTLPVVQEKSFDIPSFLNEQFDNKAFEERMHGWRLHQQQKRRLESERVIRHALQNPRVDTNSTVKIIPHLHQAPMFQKHLSWNLMVMVMADNECPQVRHVVNETGTLVVINATERLLATLRDSLQTTYASVVAYLPHYAGKQNCRDAMHQSIVQTFPGALQSGQLQVITPPLQQDRGEPFTFAMNGFDFAYAAEFGFHYSDVFLFLQAGSRLKQEWWIRYVPAPTEPPKNDTTKEKAAPDPNIKWEREISTANRDYGLQVLLAFEDHYRLDEDGLEHQLCYMNFATYNEKTPYQYANWMNPTGALFESSSLLRLSVALRSFLPYGKLPVSTLLNRYCKDLLWKSHRPDGPTQLFQYVAKGNETRALKQQTDLLPITSTTTYPYTTVSQEEIPSWVSLDASMIGPHSTMEKNPFLQTIQDGHPIIPTAVRTNGADAINGEKYWMTFIIPTAWRHTMTGSSEEGNVYAKECLRQLSLIVRKHFTGKYKALILVLVSGQDQVDVDHHRKGLETAFASEIEEGIIKLVSAPIEQYPTLHGLKVNFKDPEQRVRWRSKQNLDMSAAFFAAKGYGKYMMMIEDDSGFDGLKFFSGVKRQVANMHRKDNPKDARDFNPRLARRHGKKQQHLRMSL